MQTRRLTSPVLAITLMSALLSPGSPAAHPPTEKKPVTDEYHGVKVVDDYRWLENAADPAVKTWTDAQNRLTRAYLDALPQRAAIEAQLTALSSKESASYGWPVSRPGRLFARKFQPPKQQRLLVTLASANDLASEKVVIDPNEMEPKGQVSMDWYLPSPDGKLVAVCLSKNGSEEGTLHFYNAETGAALPDRIARVQYPTGGGSAAWTPDGQGIYYTRYPRAGERPEADLNFFQQIYLHKLGTPDSADVYSAGKDFPRIAEIELQASRSGRWLVADVANGDGGEHAHYVLDTSEGARAAWRQMTQFTDGIKEAVVSCDDATLFLRSVKDASRGKILRLPLDGRARLKDATVIVPESQAVIEGMLPTASYLYVSELLGGPSRLRRFDLAGKEGRELPIPANSGVGGLVALEDQSKDDRVLFRETSFTEPDAWFLYEPATGDGKVTKTALAKTSPVSFSDIEVAREFAVSKDGTKIPLSILHRKGLKLDGQNPALLTAYGGYGISLRPGFDSDRRLWFDRGGVIAIANVRGGGEYGEEWHLAGNLTRKQTVFDDFAACARHLAERGYTQPGKLAVEGGSNGGLLMGAFLTQHPELARAVVAHVGLYDMLRVELDPNGAFNVTEFGTVKDLAQFQALHAYSPYHHVVDGTPYPAVFFLAGETDGRVNPAHSRKMTARLQAATGSKNPVLVRLSAASGHGIGTALAERIAQEADVLAFLFDQLGMNTPATPALTP
jgi:prolyl oligopeptidase